MHPLLNFLHFLRADHQANATVCSRLWDLEHGRALLQLDSAVCNSSNEDPQAPAVDAHSIQIKSRPGSRRGTITDDEDPGPPVMCCILPQNLVGPYALHPHTS